VENFGDDIEKNVLEINKRKKIIKIKPSIFFDGFIFIIFFLLGDVK
jgi:hypothetical protein